MKRNHKNFYGKNNSNYKTGIAIHGQRSSMYHSWMNMKARCLRKTNPKYHRYGGRGIKIHPPWMDIRIFFQWAIKAGFKEGLSIDRIDNDGNYCPENCQWIEHSKNSKKKSTTKIQDCQCPLIREKYKNGISMGELAKEHNVCEGTIWFIVKNITHV